jgi:hypothetical protein
MRQALKGEKMIPPHIEYKDRMTINLGERTFKLIYLKNAHSFADTAVWMPRTGTVRVIGSQCAHVYQFTPNGGVTGCHRQL